MEKEHLLTKMGQNTLEIIKIVKDMEKELLLTKMEKNM
jgi:hypothetical protein